MTTPLSTETRAYFEVHEPPHCPTCECGTPKLSDHQLRPTEKDTHLLAAYTPTSYPVPYPWYFNFTMVRLQGAVVLTVRAPTDCSVEPRRMGDTGVIRFETREMWREFVKQVEHANQVWEATDFLDSQL